MYQSRRWTGNERSPVSVFAVVVAAEFGNGCFG
jgi:hypothetical protein